MQTTTVRTAIHTRFIRPSTKPSSISAQQQPRQNTPCEKPMPSAPTGPFLQRERKKLIGLRQWRRQAALKAEIW